MTYLIKFNDTNKILEIKNVVAVEMYGVQERTYFYSTSEGMQSFPNSRIFSFVVDPNTKLPR